MRRRRNGYLRGYSLNRTIGYRLANIGEQYAPESKTRTEGNRNIDTNYCVFVRIKNCRIYEKDGKNYYDATQAPLIPITGHGLTSKAFGVPRLVNKPFYKELRTPVYLVDNGRVYTKTVVRKLFTGKIREANNAEVIAFNLKEMPYVIDNEENPGIPVVGRMNTELLNKDVLFSTSKHEETEYATLYFP